MIHHLFFGARFHIPHPCLIGMNKQKNVRQRKLPNSISSGNISDSIETAELSLTDKNRPRWQLTMSSKLVRKLLQVTATPTIDASLQTTTLKKKNRSKKNDEKNHKTLIVEDKKERLLQHHIDSLIRIDQGVPTNPQFRRGKLSKRKMGNDSQQSVPPKTASATDKAERLILGNTRSSSSILQNQELQPTFQKHIYKKHQKERKLREIAKILQATKKKMTKQSTIKQKQTK